MAWTYFTTDLADGDDITREQIGELWEALSERYELIDRIDGRTAMMAELADWPRSARVPMETLTGGQALFSMSALLDGIANRHVTETTDTAVLGVSGWKSAVESDMGLAAGTIAQWITDVFAGVEIREYYNAIRRGIIKCAHLNIAELTPAGSNYRRLGSGDTLATLETSFSAAGETTHSATSGVLVGLRVRRNDIGDTRVATSWRSEAGGGVPVFTQSPAKLAAVPAWCYVFGQAPIDGGTFTTGKVTLYAFDDAAASIFSTTSGDVVEDDWLYVDLGTITPHSLEGYGVRPEIHTGGDLSSYYPSSAGEALGYSLLGLSHVYCTPHYDYT